MNFAGPYISHNHIIRHLISWFVCVCTVFSWVCGQMELKCAVAIEKARTGSSREIGSNKNSKIWTKLYWSWWPMAMQCFVFSNRIYTELAPVAHRDRLRSEILLLHLANQHILWIWRIAIAHGTVRISNSPSPRNSFVMCMRYIYNTLGSIQARPLSRVHS